MQGHSRKKRSLEIFTEDSTHFKRRVSPRTTDRWAGAHELTPGLSILTDSFSTSFNSFDSNIDMLEGGGARQVIGDELLSPVVNLRKWEHCMVKRIKKVEFTMIDEKTKEVMLTARKIGDAFYLSCYSDFPSNVGDSPLEGRGAKQPVSSTQNPPKYNLASVCAIIRLDKKKKRYSLFSRSCELCDGVLSRFTCGPESPPTGDRQLLAEIEHEVVHIERAQTDCRRIAVELPFVHKSDKSRVVWCPRSGTPRDKARKESLVGLGMSGATPVRVRRSNSGTDSLREIVKKTTPKSSTDDGKGGGFRDGDSGEDGWSSEDSEGKKMRATATALSPKKKEGTWQDDKHRHRLLLMSNLPKWNDRVESFCMNFHGQRIKVASSKNFVFSSNQRSDLPTGGAAKSPSKSKSSHNIAILQFGKQTEDGTRFALDFRYPIAPVQAFAIFLTSTGWAGPKSKK
jgi:hypothetical protein